MKDKCEHSKTAWQTGYNDVYYSCAGWFLPGCKCDDCVSEYNNGRKNAKKKIEKEKQTDES